MPDRFRRSAGDYRPGFAEWLEAESDRKVDSDGRPGSENRRLARRESGSRGDRWFQPAPTRRGGYETEQMAQRITLKSGYNGLAWIMSNQKSIVGTVGSPRLAAAQGPQWA